MKITINDQRNLKKNVVQLFLYIFKLKPKTLNCYVTLRFQLIIYIKPFDLFLKYKFFKFKAIALTT